jgi:hypothetical protein
VHYVAQILSAKEIKAMVIKVKVIKVKANKVDSLPIPGRLFPTKSLCDRTTVCGLQTTNMFITMA